MGSEAVSGRSWNEPRFWRGPNPDRKARQLWPAVGPGHVVAIHFTMALDDGHVVQSSLSGRPLRYLHGVGALVPGLERALEGCRAGDRVQVIVPPEAGYSAGKPRMMRVPRADLPAGAVVVPGMRFRWQLPSGEELPARVAEVTPSDLLVVFDHPLAGKRLHFDVEVVEVL